MMALRHQPMVKGEPAHSWHFNINDQTRHPRQLVGSEELLTRGENRGFQTMRGQDASQRLAHRLVVVHDRDQRLHQMVKQCGFGPETIRLTRILRRNRGTAG